MVQRVDYYTLLSRALESLERDAYEARGAIYDREHKALVKQLMSSSSPCSDADIAGEEQAFRDAIRRIEFPDGGLQAPRAPQREPAEAAWPASGREKARALRREFPPAPANEPAARRRWDTAYEETGGEPLGRQFEFPPESTQEDEPSWDGEERKSHSLIRLAAAYALVTAIVLGAGGLGYAYVIGAIDLTWLARWPGQAAAPSERAILYQGGQSDRNGKPVEGKAIWRTRTEPNGSAGKPDTVVTLDAEIPEQHIALTMTLSRVGDAGSGMSHLLELRFARPEELPFGGISRISSIGMRGAETDASESLFGTSINIAPGQFMFGLLGVEEVVRQNVQRLRTQNWLDFSIIFVNGPAATLTVEKGVSGQRAIKDRKSVV